VRAQLGLKLRAMNSCNLIYVMWRSEPKSEVTVQIKHNPGKVTHEDCGTAGYKRIKHTTRKKPPVLAPNAQHKLSAAIDGDALVVHIDDKLVWQGTLPAEARDLGGPAGFRTDNVKAELALETTARAGAPACPKPGNED